MRKLLFVALPVGLVMLVGIFVSSRSRTAADTMEARLERARLKRDFTERAQAAKALAPDRLAEWQTEVSALSRWYFDELTAIRNRHPSEPPRLTGLEAAEEDKKGKLKAEDREAIADFQQYAESRLRVLRDGQYTPIASAAAEGMRLDLISVQPGPAPGAGPGLRIDFALWGAPRYVERERSSERTITRNVVPVAFKKLAIRFLDPDGKLYGEMSGAGEPYQKLADPERFDDDFPPGVLFGTWWVELFPREAASIEFELGMDARGASGATWPATLQTQIAIPEAWKLPPGTAFQAEVRHAEPQ